MEHEENKGNSRRTRGRLGEQGGCMMSRRRHESHVDSRRTKGIRRTREVQTQQGEYKENIGNKEKKIQKKTRRRERRELSEDNEKEENTKRTVNTREQWQ